MGALPAGTTPPDFHVPPAPERKSAPAIGPNDHVRGRADAPFELVEYGDYQCPFCRLAQGVVHGLRRRLGDQLRLAYRHFPLTQVHPHAQIAAESAEAAGAQGRFWEMHGLLYANQPALSPHLITQFADHLGLDLARFADDVHERRHRAKVRHDFMSGVRSGVTGTPTFFVHGVRHEGSFDEESLWAALAARASAVPPARG